MDIGDKTEIVLRDVHDIDVAQTQRCARCVPNLMKGVTYTTIIKSPAVATRPRNDFLL